MVFCSSGFIDILEYIENLFKYFYSFVLVIFVLFFCLIGCIGSIWYKILIWIFLVNNGEVLRSVRGVFRNFMWIKIFMGVLSLLGRYFWGEFKS